MAESMNSLPADAPSDSSRPHGLVTVGESLALLAATEPGPLRHRRALALGIGGAESNVAIGVRRLGAPASWVGRVGDDELGALVLRTLRAEAVDVSGAIVDGGAPTSLMLRERTAGGGARVDYYRAHGPGARLRPDDLDGVRLDRAGVVHLTGITLALSASARATAHAAAAAASAAGVPVSFDVNYRAKLWDPATARPAVEALCALADHVFVGDDEAAALGWGEDPAVIAAHVRGLGARVAIVKRGAAGAIAFAPEGACEAPALPVELVDLVGAGDAFAAGYLAELLARRPLEQRMRTATACAAAIVATCGDWEGAATRTELRRLGAEAGTVER